MRRYIHKPRGIVIRKFVARMNELNDLLVEFPPFKPNQPLSEDDLMDIFEHSIPYSWTGIMNEHAFEPIQHTPAEFVEFCERIELNESPEDFQKPDTQNNSKKSAKQPSKESANTTDQKKRKAPFCDLHRCTGHSTGECKVVLAQVQSMRSSWDAQASTTKKPWNGKGKRSKYREFNGQDNRKKTAVTQETVNAMVARALAGATKKRKKDEESEDSSIFSESQGTLDLENYAFDKAFASMPAPTPSDEEDEEDE